MRIIDKGHAYELASLDGEAAQKLVFVKRFRGTENHAGTTTQEVLRVLIDRTQTLDAECPWDGNDKIVGHLRMALVLFEARALERKAEKGEIQPELIDVSERDGHIALRFAP
jgi:hypothetical protein